MGGSRENHASPHPPKGARCGSAVQCWAENGYHFRKEGGKEERERVKWWAGDRGGDPVEKGGGKEVAKDRKRRYRSFDVKPKAGVAQ